MARTRWMLVIFLAMALAPLVCGQEAPKHHKSRKPVKQVVLPPLPPGPLPPVPLDQLPSVPPQVSYQNGKLEIVAENSTLGDILRDVRKRTGASFDIPANANDRVATRLGPGPARDVLATLLNGTSFNYVMLGSANDPTALSSLVLTAKPAGGATETAQTQTAQNQPAPVNTAPNFGPGTGRPGFMPPQPPQPVQTAENADDKDDEDADDQDQDQQAEGQQGQPGTPIQAPGLMPQQPDQTDQNGQPVNAGPRTPQQILQMLQQQRQQQQQQPNQGEQPPPQ